MYNFGYVYLGMSLFRKLDLLAYGRGSKYSGRLPEKRERDVAPW